MRPPELSDRERHFCERYVIHFKANEAAREAGYAANSEKSLNNQASRLLARAGIQKKIKELTALSAQKNESLKDRVIKALADIAFTGMGDVGSWTKEGDFTMKASEELSAAAQYSIQEISRTTSPGGVARLKVKLTDRVRSLELIGRHIGLFDADANGNLPKPIVIELLDGGKIVLGAKQQKAGGE